MSFNYVKIKNFRNFNNISIVTHKGLNTFFGKNGQGKTNLSESLFIISRGKSFRKIKRDELIKYGEKEAVIETEIEKDNFKIKINENDKKTFFNDKQIQKKLVFIDCYFINSDLLFYFKNFPHFRIKLIDKLCYNVYGVDFLINYQKYTKAEKNLRNDPYNKIWINILSKYGKTLHDYRVDFFKKIKNDYSRVKEYLRLEECVINFDGKERKKLNILRKDKRDLSLGELKSIIFSIIYSTISIDDRKFKIFILDDFNSEWDIDKQRKVKKLISELKIQSYIMETQLSEDTNFIIEKGEINSL